jgi:hypothetical protein
VTNVEIIALLREARGHVFNWPDYTVAQKRSLLDRIDAALAAHEAEERVDSATPVVESDIWWSPSSHRASKGKCDLHVWRMNLKEWGWSTTVYRDHERGREDLGNGVCNTLDEAKAAAIAAARGMR